MQTNFTLAQLQDSDVADSEKILRTCVHCGFCTATCPTYVLLGDELDSPRGRIYLIKDMLENDRPAAAKVVKHIDRCLSCLSCMTTCPSGVHYMHLVDHARKHIEETYTRPITDRLLREVLATILPYPMRFRIALTGTMATRWAWALAARMLRPVLAPEQGSGSSGPKLRTGFAALFERIDAMYALAPKSMSGPSQVDRPQSFPAKGPRRARVALLSACAQQVLAPEINEATIRLLRRHGVEVVVAKGAGCCGALVHHMGKEAAALTAAKANVAAWTAELEGEGLDAVIINASGCGTTVKDYGFMLRDDPAWDDKAAKISALTKDITEFMSDLGLDEPPYGIGYKVAYHSACSMQHGQKITKAPKELLAAASFRPLTVPEGHLCCGSAGTYNLLQPAIAGRLRDRKVANIESLKPDLIATGNIGCMSQIASGTSVPVVHTVELLDWATGGPTPRAIAGTPLAEPRNWPIFAAATTRAAE